MKRLLFSLMLGGAVCAQAQTTLLDEGFESYTDFAITGFGSWLTLDLDLLPTYSGGLANPTWPNVHQPMAFQIFNPTAAGVTNSTDPLDELRNFDPHGGSKYAAAWNAVPSATVPGNNDWLISPALQLGTSGNELTFWVKSLSSSYGLETYKVGVYVGSGTPTSAADFTIISGATPLTAPYPNWELKTYNLDNYSGQMVRVAIQCVSSDNYMFMVDDVKVTTMAPLATNEVRGKDVSVSVYPNPASDVLNIKTKDQIKSITVFDSSGRKVNVNASDHIVYVKSLTPGTYLIIIETDKTTVTEKFIKK
ncbi:T9SS-dependent choice-of-anchor J family protein [Chryseobacterium sp. MFBS3-17]|uniref:T9SS-dependent choice-of-anchor J family protein n=1 Tax=Chryseobacterium sp. MFBS3-17 TaxID=2886689 RepID=UPI001D0EB6B0|nr:choice-of-anchor J domain-containing protein [Chryseobacterium sp. MFBS3-17]MCC2590136.1 choice-of-anchor J domain-containing protein [Chryseobacterium sp. MFBS3-17]